MKPNTAVEGTLLQEGIQDTSVDKTPGRRPGTEALGLELSE
jgi:hypothetical protein